MQTLLVAAPNHADYRHTNAHLPFQQQIASIKDFREEYTRHNLQFVSCYTRILSRVIVFIVMVVRCFKGDVVHLQNYVWTMMQFSAQLQKCDIAKLCVCHKPSSFVYWLSILMIVVKRTFGNWQEPPCVHDSFVAKNVLQKSHNKNWDKIKHRKNI